MDSIINFFIIDLPEALLVFMLALAMFDESVFAKRLQTTVSSLIYAISGIGCTLLEVPYQYKIIVMFLITVLLIHRIFKKTIVKAVVMASATFIVFLSIEFIIATCFNVLNISIDQLMSSPVLRFFASYSYLLSLFITAMTMRFTRFDLRNLFPKTKNNRYLFLLVLVGSIEFLMILLMNTSYILKQNNADYLIIQSPTQHIIIQAVSLVLFMVLVLLFRTYLNLTINRVEEETGKPYLKNIKDLLVAINTFRHDFVNHFTVVDGFIKGDMSDRAKEYIGDILKETKAFSYPIKGIKDPAVSLLLQSKIAVCQANNIDMEIEILTPLPFGKLCSKDRVCLIGNLLDNAINATERINEGRYIKMIRTESKFDHKLIIENSGETIPPDILSKMFELGVTTKTEGSGGSGLYIVKKIVEKYRGAITVYSTSGVTRMSISIPK